LATGVKNLISKMSWKCMDEPLCLPQLPSVTYIQGTKLLARCF
jgi:hypothetical protein